MAFSDEMIQSTAHAAAEEQVQSHAPTSSFCKEMEERNKNQKFNNFFLSFWGNGIIKAKANPG